MRTETKFKWAVGVAIVMAIGLIVQGVLLWQTRSEQTVAGLDPDPAVNSIEQKILKQLDDEEPQSQFLDPWGGSLFGSDPFAQMDKQMQQMRQQMNSLFSGATLPGNAVTFSLQSPDIELEETADDFRVVINVPENSEIELNTDVEDQEVTVSGKVSAQMDRSGNGFNGQFISSSQFSRRFDLPGEVDELGVRTENSDNGLVVVIPKKTHKSA